MSARLAALACCLTFLTPACASRSPVLYPNAKLQRVGKQVAQGDVEQCLEWAADEGHEPDHAARLATRTGEGAVTGAAVGAASGAVRGTTGVDAGRGAAGGAAGGLVRGLFRSRDPDPIQRRFVEECLRDQGYRTIGWR